MTTNMSTWLRLCDRSIWLQFDFGKRESEILAIFEVDFVWC